MKRTLFWAMMLLSTFSLLLSVVSPASAAGLTLSTISATGSGAVKLTFEVSGAPPASSSTYVHVG